MMNERIKELSKQAVIALRAKNSPDLPPLEDAMIEKILELRVDYDAMFAELIVRECAVQCEEIGFRWHSTDSAHKAGAKAGAVKCAEDLLKHFGVK